MSASADLPAAHGVGSRSDLAHKAAAPKQVGFMIVTVSDTRTPENDDSGKIIRRQVEDAGHRVALYRVVKDEPYLVEGAIQEGVAEPAVDIMVLNGGTGMSSRDGTFEQVSTLIEKPMPGFGELFRMLSWQQVGSAAMLSRAVAGLYAGKMIFSIPGSPKAAELAMSLLIIPEAGHLMFEARR